MYFGNEHYGEVTSHAISAGRDISAADCRTRARVCVIGETLRKYFFGAMSPIGQKLQIGGKGFEVIGVYAGKYDGKLNTDDQMIVMPYTLRAPTPSGAAEFAVPDRTEYALNLRTLDARLHTAAHRRAEQQRKLLDGLQERLSNRTPMKYIEEKRLLLTQTEERLFSAVPVRLETERNRLNGLQQRLLAAGQSGLHRRKLRFAQTVATLDAMSPLRVLGRGYAVATKGVKHTVVTDAAALKQGDTLHIQFAKGAADCRVTDIEEDK